MLLMRQPELAVLPTECLGRTYRDVAVLPTECLGRTYRDVAVSPWCSNRTDKSPPTERSPEKQFRWFPFAALGA